MKIWKIGIIGCGNIAETVYLPQMSRISNIKPAAVCDQIAERSKYIAEKFGIEKWYIDIDEFLEKSDVDIVMSIAAIHGRHEVNMKILNAGKHLYSQKPFAPGVKEATEQIELANANNLVLSTAPVHRNRPDIRMAKQIIDRGLIGHISLMNITLSHGGPEYYQYRDSDPSWFYQKGAGALLDMGVHGLDQMIALLGPAKYVSCMAAISEPKRTIRSGSLDGQVIDTNEIPDNYIISLDFGNGTLGVLSTGFVQKASLRSDGGFEIFGNKGTINIGSGASYESAANVKLYLDKPEDGLRGWIEPLPIIGAPQNEYFQCLCISDLIDAVETGRPSNLSPEHARHIIEIMNVIPEAIESGNRIALKTSILEILQYEAKHNNFLPRQYQPCF